MTVLYTDIGLIRSASIVAREAGRDLVADALDRRIAEMEAAQEPANAFGLTPLHTCCIIEFEPADKTTDGGILLPDSLQEVPPGFATVLAVGPGAVVANLEEAYAETLDPITGEFATIERRGDLRVLTPPPTLKPGVRVIAQRYGGMVVPRPDHCLPHPRWQQQLVRCILPEHILAAVYDAPEPRAIDGQEEERHQEEAGQEDDPAIAALAKELAAEG